MLSMISLLSDHLAAARSEDARRAGLRTRVPSRITPQRVTLLDRVRGRRVARLSRRRGADSRVTC